MTRISYFGQEGGGFYARNIEGLAAAGIAAAGAVVEEDHVALRLVETGAVFGGKLFEWIRATRGGKDDVLAIRGKGGLGIISRLFS